MDFNFEGNWLGRGFVCYTILDNNNPTNTVIVDSTIILTVRKIIDNTYYIIFNNNNKIFNCVATQSTENKLLLQSATGGLDSFYFTTDPNLLNVNWTTPAKSNTCESANIKFNRIIN